MKRSLQVSAPLLASAALAVLTGCHQRPEPQRCVDDQNHVVDPKFCANLPQPAPNQQNHVGYGPLFLPYHYIYGGSGGFTPGAIVTGGSLTPLAGHSYSSTVRGGFGSTFGGGDSSSGAHGSGSSGE